MDKWTELRTALHVAKLGTVSAAAQALRIHRATVNRHIDALEDEIGSRIFIRHARGYTLTETGEDVLRVAQKTDDLIADLSCRVQGQRARIEGEIKLSILPAFAPLILDAVAAFRAENPQCRVQINASDDLARLEYAEAHVAIRAGAKPDNPDYVVQLFSTIGIGLYAHKSYIERKGMPHSVEDLSQHEFILPPGNKGRGPFWPWVRQNIDPRQITVSSDDLQFCGQAVTSGLGLGFLFDDSVQGKPDMVEVIPRLEEWKAALWLVTHVDLHRTEKVDAMLRQLKANRRR